MTETLATIRATADRFNRIIDEASLDGDQEHGDLYFNLLEDRLQVLMAAPGEVVLSYCAYEEEYFDDISLEVDQQTRTADYNGEFEYETGVEAIINVEETQTALGFADGGGTVELKFEGEDDRRLATTLRADGALEAWATLPGSESILDRVPHWLSGRYNDDDVYCNQAGDPAPTRIKTRVDQVGSIIDAVQNDRDAEFFPIVVEDDDFVIDVGDEQRSGVSGVLSAESVSGPDVENYYFDGFVEILNPLSGPIELQTAPDGAPISIVQRDENRIVRHSNGAVEV